MYTCYISTVLRIWSCSVNGALTHKPDMCSSPVQDSSSVSFQMTVALDASPYLALYIRIFIVFSCKLLLQINASRMRD